MVNKSVEVWPLSSILTLTSRKSIELVGHPDIYLNFGMDAVWALMKLFKTGFSLLKSFGCVRCSLFHPRKTPVRRLVWR